MNDTKRLQKNNITTKNKYVTKSAVYLLDYPEYHESDGVGK